MNKKQIRIGILGIVLIIAVIFVYHLLYIFNFIPHKKYTNEDFNIETYKSRIDRDEDSIDDQTDIMKNVRAYIATKPQYKSKYYESGYPNDEYGVCTDVVAQGLLHAGYDLQQLVDEDIKRNMDDYNVEKPDKKIDFRRVRNLRVYFENHAISLTTDIDEVEQWQGGDIVVFEKHVGIVSDKRNKDGIPFVIHHANPLQKQYEEDILPYRDDIVGHFRIS